MECFGLHFSAYTCAKGTQEPPQGKGRVKKGSGYRDEGLCWLFEKITSFRFQKSYKLLCLHRLQHLLDVVVVVVVAVVAATTQGGPGQKGLTLKFDGM